MAKKTAKKVAKKVAGGATPEAEASTRLRPEGAQNAGAPANEGVPVGAPHGSEAISGEAPKPAENKTTKVTAKTQKQEDNQVRTAGGDGKLLTERQNAVKAELEKQEKVRVMIPLGIGEKNPAYQEVQINGYTIYIKKGTYVDVPQTVADLIADSQKQTLEAGQEFLIDRDPRIREALGA